MREGSQGRCKFWCSFGHLFLKRFKHLSLVKKYCKTGFSASGTQGETVCEVAVFYVHTYDTSLRFTDSFTFWNTGPKGSHRDKKMSELFTIAGWRGEGQTYPADFPGSGSPRTDPLDPSMGLHRQSELSAAFERKWKRRRLTCSRVVRDVTWRASKSLWVMYEF